MRSRTNEPACATEAFLRATRVCAVGSIQEVFPGSHGQALKLGSRDTVLGNTMCASRNFNPFSIPEVWRSQSTPLWKASSCTLRTQCRVTESAVVQWGCRTAAQGCQLPSGSCQDRTSFQPRSTCSLDLGLPCNAISA